MMRSDLLALFQQLIEDQKVNFTLLEAPYDKIRHFDLGLRQLIYQDYSFASLKEFLSSLSEEPILYHYTDLYQCNYSLFRLDHNHDPSYVIIGPYLETEISTQKFQQILEEINLPAGMENELQEYFNAVPVFQEITRFHSMLSIMTARTLENPSNFSVQFLDSIDEMGMSQIGYRSDSAPEISSKMIEDRYKAENELLLDVAQGNAAKALNSYHNFLQFHMAPRFKDPIRNIKNLTIVLNTLLRKAVEGSHVHPIHIDEVSRGFAIQIEAIHSLKEADALQTVMLRKYCLLVKNHSLTGYSPLIQRVINYIDMNISEALSLRLLSDLFSINSSYLSTLFKKEMGMTLTDFINQQKIRYAITLLNRTDTQIQNIATQVGIYDVNYFIKVFKKISGMTPKEYRDSIKGRREL